MMIEHMESVLEDIAEVKKLIMDFDNASYDYTQDWRKAQ
jgi:hypothetical protein